MKKHFTPDNTGADEEPGFEVGEFGFISTDTKDLCKRKGTTKQKKKPHTKAARPPQNSKKDSI